MGFLNSGLTLLDVDAYGLQREEVTVLESKTSSVFLHFLCKFYLFDHQRVSLR